MTDTPVHCRGGGGCAGVSPPAAALTALTVRTDRSLVTAAAVETPPLTRRIFHKLRKGEAPKQTGEVGAQRGQTWWPRTRCVHCAGAAWQRGALPRLATKGNLEEKLKQYNWKEKKNHELKFGCREGCCARLCGAFPRITPKARFCRQARAAQPLPPRALTGSWAPHQPPAHSPTHPQPLYPPRPPPPAYSYLHLLIYFPFHRMCGLSAPLVFRRSALFLHLCHAFFAILVSIFAARRGGVKGVAGWVKKVWKRWRGELEGEEGRGRRRRGRSQLPDGGGRLAASPPRPE